MNLLLIDDDIVDRMDAVRLLKNSGKDVKITEACNAESGIRLASEAKYDLILLDYQLPGMDGLEVLSSLNENEDSATAVVMLSHSEDDELALQCIKCGAQDYVKKSEVTTSRLMRAIEHAKVRFGIQLQLQKSKEQLRKLAETDCLTGLLNRYAFQINVKGALHSARRHGNSMAMLMLDLDKFKQINDTLGHDVGDELLIAVSERLNSIIRVDELLSRLGGDEFAILIQHLIFPSQARTLAQRVREEFQKPFVLAGKAYNITMSIGIAVYPDCADDPEHLMKCADIAMYRSKKAGRNQVSFYSRAVHQKVMQRVELENSLFRAWRRAEFQLYYQPIVDTHSGQLVAMESLIRWNHPECGLILPGQFIDLAEEIGLIHHLGLWILDSACSQWYEWFAQQGDDSPSISVNVSALQLSEPDFVQSVIQTVERCQIPPAKLTLELTESHLDTSEQARRALRALAKYGIRLALDDFGTGYASLSVLYHNPFSILKIDRSFVETVNSDRFDKSFLSALAEFAQAAGYRTVAEGIETQQQLELCQALNFDTVQGYFFDKPAGADEFAERWLRLT